MNQKPLFLAVTLVALLVIGGAFCFMQKRQAISQPVVTAPVVETSAQTGPEKYPQYIEAIPGNTDEVWYNIPELGVRMKLNKGFAEDLVYVYQHEGDDEGGEWDSTNFSTKLLTNIDKSCAPESRVIGSLVKTRGNAKELAKTDVYFSSRLNSLVQISEFYYMWIGPQATCWDPKNDEAISKVRGPEVYRSIQEGVKTIELIPFK